MRRRIGVIGLIAVLSAGALLVSSVPTVSPQPIWQAAAQQPAGAEATAVATASPPAAPPAPVRSYGEPPAGAIQPGDAISELKGRGNAVNLDSTGVVRSVTAAPGKNLGADSDAFVRRYAAAFGLFQGHTLTRRSAAGLPGGDSAVRYQQVAAGLPVLGAEVIVTTTSAGAVRSAIVGVNPVAPAASAAKVSPSQAETKAIEAAAKEFGATEGITAKATLWQYAPEGSAELRPTYLVRLSEGDGHALATVLIDGIDGRVVLTATEHKTAKDRIVCDLARTPVNLNFQSSYLCTPGSPLGQSASARSEGEPATGVSDVDYAFNQLGVVYDYFRENFGRDSFDGLGAQLSATVRACHVGDPSWYCPFQNAFWEGDQFVFGEGWATDDVVGHEFTHAVTEHSSQLLYWGQSGAINEALSDIFGQFIDLQTPADDQGDRRWLIGEDLPSRPTGSGAIRDMLNPRRFGHPQEMYDMQYWVNSYYVDNGGVHTNSGVANRIAASLYDGVHGTALGPKLSAQLWYRVMHVLPSGANYRQLGIALQATCREMIGSSGFTPAHCQAVDNTLQAVVLTHLYGATPICSGQPVTDLFRDDFESGSGKWVTNAPNNWRVLPSFDDLFSYAASGKGAANGTTYTGGGHNGVLETAGGISVPVGGTSFLTYNSATLSGNSSGVAGVKVFVDAGQGNESVVGSDFTGLTREYRLDDPGAFLINLQQWAGKTIKLRFQIHSPGGAPTDFYLDDVHAYNCDSTKPGAIQDGYAYVSGNTLTVDWKSAYAAGSTNFNDYHFELAYSPSIPGAPATYRPTQEQPRYAVSAPGAEPGWRYTVTVKVKMDTTGAVGPAVTLVIDPRGFSACAYRTAGGYTPTYLAKSVEPVPDSICHTGPRPSPR